MSRRMSLAIRKEGGSNRSAVRFPSDLVFLDNIRENDLSAAKEMLRRASVNIDINDLGHSGLTPLHQACLDGNLAAVRLLIENGADINKLDEDTWTPLHAACEEGYLPIVKYLLESGADPNIHTNDGERPIDLVDSSDFQMIAYMLSRNLSPSDVGDDDETETGEDQGATGED